MSVQSIKIEADPGCYPARLLHVSVEAGHRVHAGQIIAVVETPLGVVELAAPAIADVCAVRASPGDELSPASAIVDIDLAAPYFAVDGQSVAVRDSASASGRARVLPWRRLGLTLGLAFGAALTAYGYVQHGQDLPYLVAEHWPDMVSMPTPRPDRRWRLESGGSVPAFRIAVGEELWTLRIEPASGEDASLRVAPAGSIRVRGAEVRFRKRDPTPLSFVAKTPLAHAEEPIPLTAADLSALASGHELRLRTDGHGELGIPLTGSALAIRAARKRWSDGALSQRLIASEGANERRRINHRQQTYQDPWPLDGIPGRRSRSDRDTAAAASPDRATDLKLDDVRSCAELSVSADDYEDRIGRLEDKLGRYRRQIASADEAMSEARTWMGVFQGLNDAQSYNRQANLYNDAVRKKRRAVSGYNGRVDSINSNRRKLNKAIRRYNAKCVSKSFLTVDIKAVCGERKFKRTRFCRS
ncbi:MAG: hypothetical protein AAF458_12095 [Pseudomonadota bacterium]